MNNGQNSNCRCAAKAAQLRRRGAVIWLVLLLIPVMAVIAFMVINVAYMSLTRTELRIATDAASRAGGRIMVVSGSLDEAKSWARDAAARNKVAGEPLRLANSDFEFGRSHRDSLDSRYAFTAIGAGEQPNALRLTGSRNASSPSGAIQLFAPQIMSIGTFEPIHTAVSTQLELDVCLVLDRSGSMAYADDEKSGAVFPPPSAPADWDFGDPVPATSRWSDAVRATHAFLDELARTPLQEEVSLVTYAETSTEDVSLTSRYQNIIAGVNAHSDQFVGGSTNIGGGVVRGIHALNVPSSRPWATKVVIVMTDGIHYTGRSPMSSARKALGSDVIVYTVTFSDEADTRTMGKVARKTGGYHVHATNGGELIQAFRHIANHLPTLLTK